MFHLYNGYHFFGMHLVWWAFWFVFVVVIFGVFEPIPRNGGRPSVGA